MADYTSIVDPNSANTSRDYASINLWEDGEDALYSSGDNAIASCQRMGSTKDTTAVTIDGWTSGVIPQIIVHDDYRHQGEPDSGYCLDFTGVSGINNGITVMVSNTIIDGLAVKGWGTDSINSLVYGIHISYSSGAYSVVKNCLIYDRYNYSNASARGNGISAGSHYMDTYAYNNVIYNVGNGFYGNHGVYAVNFVNNNTVHGVGGGVGIYLGSSAEELYNNAVFACATDFSGSATSQSNNVSSDATAPGSNSITNAIVKSYATDTLTAALKGTDNWVIFNDPANGDYSLVSVVDGSELNDAIDAGADLSASMDSVDIIGTTRPQGDYWDIGAFEFIVSSEPDPGTLLVGDDTDYTTTATGNVNANYYCVSPAITASASGTASHIKIKTTVGAGEYLSVALLDSSDNVLAYGTAPVNDTSAEWTTIQLNTTVSISSGTDYKVAIIADSACEVYEANTSAETWRYVAETYNPDGNNAHQWDASITTTGDITSFEGPLAFYVMTDPGGILLQATGWSIQTSTDRDAAWRIKAALERDTAFRIFASLTQDTAARIQTALEQSTGYAVLTSIQTDIAAKIQAALQQETAWPIQASAGIDIAWKLFTSLDAETAWPIQASAGIDIAWKLFTSLDAETAWAILTSTSLSRDLAWRIFAAREIDTAAKIRAATEQTTAWAIYNRLDQATAWEILQKYFVSADTGWGIQASETAAMGWRIFTREDIQTGWKVFNVTERDLAARIMASVEADAGWKIFNRIDLDTAWSVLSNDIPTPAVIFAAKARTLIFSAKERTLIFIAKER